MLVFHLWLKLGRCKHRGGSTGVPGRRRRGREVLGDFFSKAFILSRELTYPPKMALLEMIFIDFPFPKVGYGNSLEGIFFGGRFLIFFSVLLQKKLG